MGLALLAVLGARGSGSDNEAEPGKKKTEAESLKEDLDNLEVGLGRACAEFQAANRRLYGSSEEKPNELSEALCKGRLQDWSKRLEATGLVDNTRRAKLSLGTPPV